MKKQVRFKPEQWQKLNELKKLSSLTFSELINNTIVAYLQTNKNKVFDKLMIDIPMTSAKIIDIEEKAKKLITKANMSSQAVRRSQGLKPFISDEEIILQCIFN